LSVNPSDADGVFKAIEKKYGEAIHSGAEYESVQKFTTGSLALDYATDGGFPLGRIARAYGPYHSGKSLLGWFALREAQKLGLTGCYYNIEKQFDKDYVRDLGVDLDKLTVIEGTIMEQIGTKLEALLSVQHVHVLDSLSSAVSVEELAAKMEDWQRGMAARVWGKVFKRVEERLSATENFVFLIDQIRDSMEYGGGIRVPGGRFLEHCSSMSLNCRKGKWLYKNGDGLLDIEPKDAKKPETLANMKEPDGQEMIVRIDKSRVGTPYRSARLWYDFESRSLDRSYELAKCATFFGVVKQAGAWYNFPDSGDKVQGEHNLRVLLSEDAKLATEVERISRESI